MSKTYSEKAKFSFYNINQCGYYPFNTKEKQFGSITEILTDLKNWSKDKEFIDTKFFEVKDESDSLPTYLLNINEYKGQWLITTWNETPATDAGIASVMKNSKIESPKIVMNGVEPDSVPGYPTYFWFLPAKNIFASVRFGNRPITGYASLKKYLVDALSVVSTRMVKQTTQSDDGDDVEIIGFKNDEGNILRALPKFNSMRAKKNHGNLEKIIGYSHNIVKIERKATLQKKIPNDRKLLKLLLDVFGGYKTEDYQMLTNIRYEMPLDGFDNAKIVNDILKYWNESEGTRTDWDDFGFVFKGESNKRYWLSNELLSAEEELEISKNETDVINAEILLKSLKTKSERILIQIEK